MKISQCILLTLALVSVPLFLQFRADSRIVLSEGTRDFHVTRVIDGDTYEGFIDCGVDVWRKASVRLEGVNAPELSNRPFGEESATAVRAYIEGRTLRLITEERWSFRRLVGSLQDPDTGQSLAEWLVQHEHAVPYKD